MSVRDVYAAKACHICLFFLNVKITTAVNFHLKYKGVKDSHRDEIVILTLNQNENKNFLNIVCTLNGNIQ